MLTREETRAFYDNFGRKQDWQRIYEGRALRDLIALGEFHRAHAVLEIGCGTGAFAAEILEKHLPSDATYTATELSPTMAALAHERLEPYGDGVQIQLTDGDPRLPFADRTFDRVVSNYVFDLLPAEDIRMLVDESHRVLRPEGRICLISLTRGVGPLSHLVVWLWERAHAFRPRMVGGCRPVTLLDYVREDCWQVIRREVVVALGLPSEVVVAQKRFP